MDEVEAIPELELVRHRVGRFEADATKVLGRFETSRRARVISVAESKRMLAGLTLMQEQLFAEALECISYDLYRPAIVSAFQAFMDCIDHKVTANSMSALHVEYPKWLSHTTLDEWRESIGEHQRLEAARKLGFISKSQMKALHGYLSIRNECAHPTSYKPSLNAALGIVTDLVERAGSL